MNTVFYIASGFAISATLMVVTRKNAVHALLYLIASLLAVSVIFFILGSPFMAALEVMIYAGAIMVLFVFVIMMLNMGAESAKKENELLKPRMWIGPSIIVIGLFAEVIYMLIYRKGTPMTQGDVPPEAVGKLLFTRYILVVELAAFLLLSGVIGAYHLGQKEKNIYHRFLQPNDKP
jgi:NADH-quinone oxidoreductase subunit J